MLRNLKGQRTKLHKKIADELAITKKTIGSPFPGIDNCDEIRSQVEVSQSMLSAFKERFESLSEKIDAIFESKNDEELDKEEDFVVDVTTDLTRRIAELSAFTSRLDRQSAKAASPTEQSEGLTSIQRKIDKLMELQELQLSHPDLSSTVLSEGSTGRPSHSMKLPRIEFEKFSGNVLRFQEFWDSFTAAIHSNSTLRPVEKLNYLRAYLSGEAKEVISGISVCDNNYEVAVELVKKRFGNPQSSIDAHYSCITNLSAIPNHTSRIRNLFDQIEKHLRCLSALGEDVEHRHFISLIMSKLPREVVVRLEETNEEEEEWSVSSLRKKLQSLLSARESADRQQACAGRSSDWNVDQKGSHSPKFSRWFSKKPQSARRWPDDRRSHPATVEGLVAGEKGSSRAAIRCILCKGEHYNDQCQKFKTVDERRRVLRGCCYICLRSDHNVSQCQSTKPCFHCKQSKRHNRCLCPTKFSGRKEATIVSSDNALGADTSVYQVSSDVNRASSEVSILASGDRVLLQTAMADVKNPSNSVQLATRVLLDCASNRSYISAELAQKLQLKTHGSESFSVVTFGSDQPKTVHTSTTQIELFLKDGSCRVIDVNVVPKITGAICRSPVELPKSSYLWKNLPLADSFPLQTENSSIDFLIGNDYYLEFITGEKIQISNGLFLLGSSLGWILTGRIEGTKYKDADFSMFIDSKVNHSMSQLCSFAPPDDSLPLKPRFDDYWSLESIGIKDNPEENDDDKAVNQFNSTVKFSDGRYAVSWPWKDTAPELPENYQLAFGRFKSLLKKFQDDSELFVKYAEVIEDQERKGMIEKVMDDSLEQNHLRHYIPHHAVITPTKSTTKVRIVYDASAKVPKSSRSLNECLLRGPIILEDLCGLLLRFRTYPIGIISDIEKAFLQIGLNFPDRDVTRFLWLKNCKSASLSDNNLQIYRFCRVPFGAISSPFLLGATVKYHLKKNDSRTARQICSNLYVDNVITGTNSVEEAIELYEESKSIFNEASMNLREWVSNSATFNNCIAEVDRVKSSSTSVLGIQWNIKDDNLRLSNARREKIRSASTKRQLFQSLASVFDPLGFFTPLTVRGKLFIHQLWSEGLTWDDPVDLKLLDEWKTIATDLEQISEYQIPRFIGINSEPITSIQLICFCDASAQAYATVIYAKVISSAGSAVNLIFAKSKLSPSKSTTIPRMELLAVFIGVRCLKFVEKQLRLPVSTKILWTDSQCVLHWINSSKPLPTFIENRLKEIKKDRSIQFRHVPAPDNPADVATRGQYTFAELHSSLWWKGPPWLLNDEASWPQSAYNSNFVPDGEEVKSPEFGLVNDTCPIPPPFGIDVEQFSSLMRLYRVTAWAQRFLNKVQKKSEFHHHLEPSELAYAKKIWDRYIQIDSFPAIFQAIDRGVRCNLKEQLNIQLDDDSLLRCRGRFANADLPENQKNPKLLPKESHYTTLVIRYFHERLLHSGVSHTLSQIRMEYWIPEGRSAVRRFVSRCVICRRHGGGPYRIPDMPHWPFNRVSRSQPFSYTGLDYLGPLYTKSRTDDVQKVWICLFTCMSVRSVHLEVVEDLSASQFLMCLRRFIARRGKPIQIISDNATQFKLSKSVIEQLWGSVISHPEVTSYISSESIAWHFIVEAAPWMGGFYERLVGIVKCALKKSIGRQRLTITQLQTVITEVEAVVNSRPIVNKGEVPHDLRCISPSDFLSLTSNNGIPTPDYNELSDPSYVSAKDPVNTILGAWRKGHIILEQFWCLWKNEYLASLRERSNFRHKQLRNISNFLPAIGDIVLIGADNLPRGSWKLARIHRLIPSHDNVIRAAQLKVSSGNLINRPLKLLYPLECLNVRNGTATQLTANPNDPSDKVLQSNGSDELGPRKRGQTPTEAQPTKDCGSAMKPETKLPRRAAAIQSAKVLKELAESDKI